MYAVIVLKCKILSNKVCTTFFKWNVALQHYCCQIGIHRNLSKEDYEPKAAFLGYQTINSQLFMARKDFLKAFESKAFRIASESLRNERRANFEVQIIWSSHILTLPNLWNNCDVS